MNSLDKFPLYLAEYMPIVIFFCIAGGISLIMVCLAWMRGKRKPNSAKDSPYECGFEPFENTRHRFDIKFYLVSILFIIFDLEVAFLFPWAVSLGDIGVSGFFSMLFFLFLLTIGFIYEWRKGALDWEQ